jgi:hypothetical protein
VTAQRTEGQHCLQYADEGKNVVNRNVTEDESCMLQCNGNIPVHLQPRGSEFKVTPSAGKVMFTTFWDSQEVLLAHFSEA